MPDGTANIRAQLAYGGELARQFSGVISDHVAANPLRLFCVRGVPAHVKNVVQRTTKTTAPANFRFHRNSPLRRA